MSLKNYRKRILKFDIFLIFFEFLIGHRVDKLHRTDKIDFVKEGEWTRTKVGNKTISREALMIVSFYRLSILTKSTSLQPFKPSGYWKNDLLNSVLIIQNRIMLKIVD